MGAFTATRNRAPRGSLAYDRLLTAAVLGVASAAAFALTTRGPRETFLLIVVSLAAFALAAFVAVPRYEISLLVLMLYLGLLDGYFKLKSGSQLATVGRDALLYAIVLGALGRAFARRRMNVPPYTPWIVFFAAACVVQVANPMSGTLGHALASLKIDLEFVPLFFFGYTVMRSTRRLRMFILALLAITAVNAVVALYQYQLTPGQLASWGPGYAQLIKGTSTVGGRVAFSEVEQKAHVRPLGLGSDVGFSGSVAALAAPGAIALILLRRRWLTQAIAFALAGSVALGLVASQVRVSLLQAAFSLLAFAAFATVARRRVQVLIGIGVAVAVSVLVISIVSRDVGASVFERYHTIAPSRVASTSVSYKSGSFGFLGDYLVQYPFGAGLGRVGPATSYPGGPPADVNGENEFNFLMLELGYAGLIIVCGFLIQICVLAVRRVRRIADTETRLLLMALAASMIGILATFPGAPLLSGPPSAPFMWFVAGTLAFWLKRPDADQPITRT